ncbi:hypothetical protein [Chloroflexus islandicus]|uniref:hypothetical protein n=1 Tax=Chloroflexus islandicus TaxID=1707952 RepID=UPI0012E8060B|nr:hypothetical protein [Chloroflexus islandicus]
MNAMPESFINIRQTAFAQLVKMLTGSPSSPIIAAIVKQVSTSATVNSTDWNGTTALEHLPACGAGGSRQRSELHTKHFARPDVYHRTTRIALFLRRRGS